MDKASNAFRDVPVPLAGRPLLGVAVAAVVAALAAGCTALSDGGWAARGTPANMRALPLQVNTAESAEAYYALGRYYYYQQRFDRAEAAFRRAAELDPADPEPLNGLGVLLDRLGRYDEAQAQYRAALQRAPAAEHVLANLGYSMVLQGRAEEALAPLRQASRLDPGNEVTQANLVRAEQSVDGAAIAGESPVPGEVVSPMPVEVVVRAVTSVPPPTLLPAKPLRPFVVSVVTAELGTAGVSERMAVPEPTSEPRSMIVSVIGAEQVSKPAPSVALAGVRIEISNGNGVTGMARAMRGRFREQGVIVTRVTNAYPFDKRATVIVCNSAHRERAESLAALLPVRPRIAIGNTAHRNIDVRVILGADATRSAVRHGEQPKLARLDD